MIPFVVLTNDEEVDAAIEPGTESSAGEPPSRTEVRVGRLLGRIFGTGLALAGFSSTHFVNVVLENTRAEAWGGKMSCSASAQRQQDRRSLERRNYNDAGSVM